MNMKKYTASAKGFTLVELIVVIVILAILATIAFLSFSSQSSAARDSKRKTDLSSIASKMNVSMANGSKLMSMVDNTATTPVSKLAAGYLAGYPISASMTTTYTAFAPSYDAGKVNFSAIGVKAEDFADPQGGDYRIGATNLAGQTFHLASKIENDDSGSPVSAGAFISGNFVSRDLTAATTVKNVAKSSDGNTFTVVLDSDSDAGKFYAGDLLSNGCYVKSVSSDKTKLTLADNGDDTACSTITDAAAFGTSITTSNKDVSALIADTTGAALTTSANPY